MTIQLSPDQEEILRRKLQLAQEIVAASDQKEAKRLANDKNDWLVEGLNGGRMGLSMVARAVIALAKPQYREREIGNVQEEDRELFLHLLGHPTMVALGEVAKPMSRKLLD